jgi:hypothetical protein
MLIKLLDSLFNSILIGAALYATSVWVINIIKFLTQFLSMLNNRTELKSIGCGGKDGAFMIFAWMLVVFFWNVFTNFSAFFKG